MAATETLISLAMLKVNVDQGKDYLDYLRPFILQVLIDHRPDPVTDQVVSRHLRAQFGLEIPSRAVQVVLKRLSRMYPLKRTEGAYHITGVLPDPGITREKSDADRHIQAVISGLLEFDKDGSQSLTNADVAVTALCGFLTEFNIPCLRAYLRGTTIPNVEGRQHAQIVLVSEYVLYLQRSDPERFASFMVLVQGHMLANALLCPDLQNVPRTYKGVTFYLDTPLLVQRLGFEGEPKKRAVEELVALVRALDGRVSTFSHSRDELFRVLKSAADHIEAWNGRGLIIMEARRSGRTKSDVLLSAGKLDEQLADVGIEVQSTPSYMKTFQIDEEAFGQVLEDEVSYFNPRAKEYDINSVRSIYVLRANMSPSSIERCKAVLVSSNSGFARAAYEYGKQHDESREVLSVITDFSLANMAWLKAPMGAPSIPMTELLAYSYAALQPPKALLDKYLIEIDKLQKQGKISERDHQILRSSATAQDELMRLTLGDDAALTEETVTETLYRVTSEIKKEENEKVLKLQELHRQTREQLEVTAAARESLQRRSYWKLRRKSQRYAWLVTCLIGSLLVLGVVAGLGYKAESPMIGWSLLVGSVSLAIATLANAFFGTTVQQVHAAIQSRILTYFLRQEFQATGVYFGAGG